MIRSNQALFAALAALSLAACGGPEAGESDRQAAGTTGAAPDAGTPGQLPRGPAAGDAPQTRDLAAAPGSAGAPVAPGAPPTPGGSTGAPVAQSSAPPVPVEIAPDAAAILRRAERAYDAVRTMEADFVQNLSVPILDSSQNSAGKLYLRRPDRFAMKFSDPAGDLVVADGRHLWMYYPSSDAKQVIRASVAQAGQSVDLQKEFLSNPTERFNAVLHGTERVGGRNAHLLTLVPRRPAAYQKVRIWVDAEDALVRRFEITEQNESVRRLELRNLKPNAAVPDPVFRFTPPPGAQVFEQ